MKTNSESTMKNDRWKLIKRTPRSGIKPSAELQAISNQVSQEQAVLVRQGRLTVDQADMEHWHQVWDRAINKKQIKLSGKYQYQRTLRNG